MIDLKPGQFITPIREITRLRMENWQFAGECTYQGGGIMPGTQLRIIEVNKIAGDMWAKVELPYTDPPAVLKIAGGEFAHNFKSI